MLHVQKSRITVIMMLTLGILSLYAALAGVLDQHIYQEALSAGLLPSKSAFAGAYSQDFCTIGVALILIFLSVRFLSRPRMKTFISSLGLTGYLFYSYAVYAFGGLFTSIYLVYLAILALSIYTLILGLASFEPKQVRYSFLPKPLRLSIAIFLTVMVVVMIPMLLGQLIPYTTNHLRPDIHPVPALDLCVVLPACAVIAAQLLGKRPFGNLLAGVGLMKILTLALSVVLGTWIAPMYGVPTDNNSLTFFGGLSIIGLVLFGWYMWALEESSNQNSMIDEEA